MNTRISFRALVRSYRIWVALLAVPLLVNGMLWACVVAPQRAKLRAWRETQVDATLKPKFEALLAQSGQLVRDWSLGTVTREDPSAVMQTVQRLADLHRVVVTEMKMEGHSAKVAEHAVAGLSAMPVQLEVTGRFGKLARWISDVESHPGLEVDAWTITPGAKPDDPHHLMITMNAFLRDI